MTSRNIKTTVTIGGAIAGSLPSSTKKAVAELDRLKVAQSGDVAEATRLRTALRGLSRGSDDYKLRVQQLKDVQSRINYRTDEIGRAGAATRKADMGVGGLTQRFTGLAAKLGPVGLGLGAVTGIVLGLGAAFSKAGAEANNILLTSARFGVSTEAFQRGQVFLRHFTQDAGAARSQLEAILKVSQDFRRIRFGEQLDPSRFLAASRLGLNVNDLVTGQLDPQELLKGVVAGFNNLDPVEARLRAEVLGGPEFAAIAESIHQGNLSFDAAEQQAKEAKILSDQQLQANREMGQNVDEIRRKIGEMSTAIVTKLVPYASVIAKGILNHLVPLFERVANFLGGPEKVEDLRSREQDLSKQLGGLIGGGAKLNDPVVQDLLILRTEVRERLGEAETRERVLDSPGGRLLNSSLTLGQGDRIVDVIQQSSRGLSERFGSGNNQGLDNFDRGFGASREAFHRNLPGGIQNAVTAAILATPIAQDLKSDTASFVQELRKDVGGLLGSLVPRQDGGRVRPGETTLVGEDGPEIARFPGGTEIITNPRINDRLAAIRRNSIGGIVPRQGGGIVHPGEITLVGEDGPEIARFPGGTEILSIGAEGRDRAAPTPEVRLQPINQYFTVNIYNPSSDLDVERALEDAASRIIPTT